MIRHNGDVCTQKINFSYNYFLNINIVYLIIVDKK